jgi:polysaccharide export outer membrane protein
MNIRMQVTAAAIVAMLGAFPAAVAAQQPARLTAVKAAKAATPVQPIPAARAAQPADYRLEALGMGDMIRVSVFRNPDLTTEARVSERGTIMFPLIGEISVTGLTPTQVSRQIAGKLRAGRFVVDPEVTVSIAQVNSRQVAVLGNVQKPGRYPLDATTAKVTDLIALAGGIAPTGSDQITVMTTRNGKTERREIDLAAMIRSGDLTQNLDLQAGDTLYVGRAPMIYVTGEVTRAGAYRVEKDMTVMQAIALGGGITPRGTERGIRIHRKNGDGQIHRMEAKLTDPVQTDDVIFVRESLF